MAGCFERSMMVDWHPRLNAYPVEWLLRNGRWAQPYAVLRQIDTRFEGGVWGVRYELRNYTTKELLGTFDSGDEASVWAWDWMLDKNRKRHQAAATRQHEIHRDTPGMANSPERTERD